MANDGFMSQSTTSTPSRPLVIWCGAGFQGAALEMLRAGTAGHTLAFSTDTDTDLSAADVAFGQPDPEIVLSSPRLRWVHITSAGYTRYDRDDLREAMKQRGAMLTNSSHVYDEPCAQHTLAMMLALARQLPQCLETQRTDREWRIGPRRAASYLLDGSQTVLLLGFGAIGRRLAELLAPLGVRVIAVRRSVPESGRENGVEVIGEGQLNGTLSIADHVVNVLPESPSTIGFVSAERIARMKPGARLYNVGRGTTLDQEALMAALHSGQVGAAYLDVTDPEPLPPDHPLWTTPNCFITPHSAGGHLGEHERLTRHFLNNLAAFVKGEALEDRVI